MPRRKSEGGEPDFGLKYPLLRDRATEATSADESQLFTQPSGTTGSSGSFPLHRKFQWMQSWNVPGWRYHRRYPRRDFGSPLRMYTIKVPFYGDTIYAWNKPTSSSIQEFRGRLTADPATPAIMSRVLGADVGGSDFTWFKGICGGEAGDGTLDSRGSSAISIVKPTNPAVDIATALGDLMRDGLPSLPGHTEGKSQGGVKLNGNIGSEYLNLAFGWSPTISDGRHFIRAIRNHDAIISQYIRDSGKLIHRSWNFDPIETMTKTVTTSTAPGYWGGIGPTGLQLNLGTRTVYKKVTEQYWFDGVFSYYLNEAVFGKRIAVLDRLFGVVPDSETAWELTPWSWLVDWFSNTGQVLSNIDAFKLDGLVMPWGYIMHQVDTVTETTWSGSYRQGAQTIPLVLYDKLQAQVKQRRPATPYGFGLDWSGFTPGRLAILAALGISRV